MFICWCIHAWVWVYVWVHIRTSVCAYDKASVQVHAYVYAHVCMHVYANIHSYAFVCTSWYYLLLHMQSKYTACLIMQKSPACYTKSPVLCMISKKPWILLKCPTFCQKSPTILSKELYIQWQEPCGLSEDPYVQFTCDILACDRACEALYPTCARIYTYIYI